MKIVDFIKELDTKYLQTYNNAMELVKAGLDVFKEIRNDLATNNPALYQSDENFIEVPGPNGYITVELRVIYTGYLAVVWGDGTREEFCYGDDILQNRITPQDLLNRYATNRAANVVTPNYISNNTIYPPIPVPGGHAKYYGSTVFLDPLSNVLNKMPTGNGKPNCQHQWQKYTGLSKTDYFCTKCNEKRDELP